MTSFLRLDRDRLLSAFAVAAIHAALAWALLTGLAVGVPRVLTETLATFDVRRPPPPPKPRDPPPQTAPRAPARAGRASPANLKSVATPVVAPDTPIPRPLPITVAPIAGAGDDPTAGAAPVVGPGHGAGGSGDGTGSGGAGDGTGGGGGGGTPVRLIRSGLGDIDCGTPETGCPSRAVGIRFTVGTDGRARGCAVTGPSGDPSLDRETCRRIEQKLRYLPARDRAGRRIAQIVNGVHEWAEIVARPEPEDDR